MDDIDKDISAIEEEAKSFFLHCQSRSKEKNSLTIFMLGNVDVGKTYLTTIIANKFFEKGLRVAIVDADVGQSNIGPPCSIGLGFLHRRVKKLSEVPIYNLYFAGNTSPSGCMHECLHGLLKEVKKAKEQKANVIIVDPTGWIEGKEACKFKLLEIERSEVSLVIAIEKRNELEHITRLLGNVKVINRHPFEEIKSRTREERRALREEAYNKYFSAARNRFFDISLLRRMPNLEKGTLLGIFKRGECLGLGILEKVEKDRAVIFTTVEENGIDGIKSGFVKLRRVNGRLKEAIFPFKSFL